MAAFAFLVFARLVVALGMIMRLVDSRLPGAFPSWGYWRRLIAPVFAGSDSSGNTFDRMGFVKGPLGPSIRQGKACCKFNASLTQSPQGVKCRAHSEQSRRASFWQVSMAFSTPGRRVTAEDGQLASRAHSHSTRSRGG